MPTATATVAADTFPQALIIENTRQYSESVESTLGEYTFQFRTPQLSASMGTIVGPSTFNFAHQACPEFRASKDFQFFDQSKPKLLSPTTPQRGTSDGGESVAITIENFPEVVAIPLKNDALFC